MICIECEGRPEEYVQAFPVYAEVTQCVECKNQGWKTFTNPSFKNKEKCEVFNLGTGNGVTIFEAIKAFETVTGQKLNYKVGPRRPGDVIAIYANNNYAVSSLDWKIMYDLNEMMRTAWEWELKVKQDEELIQKQNSVLN